MEELGKLWMLKMIEREEEIKKTGNLELALQHIEDLKATLKYARERAAKFANKLIENGIEIDG